MRRTSSLDGLRVRQFDDIQDEISEIVDFRSEMTEGKFWEYMYIYIYIYIYKILLKCKRNVKFLVL